MDDAGSPIGQKQLFDTIKMGFPINLYVKHKSMNGNDQFYLFAQYGDVSRQIYTQRGKPRFFSDFNRVIEWAHKIGFETLSVEKIVLSDAKVLSDVD